VFLKVSAILISLIAPLAAADTIHHLQKFKFDAYQTDKIQTDDRDQCNDISNSEGCLSKKETETKKQSTNGLIQDRVQSSSFGIGKKSLVDIKPTGAVYKINDTWLTSLQWYPGVKVDDNPRIKYRKYDRLNWEFTYTDKKLSIASNFEYRYTNYEKHDKYEGTHYYWLHTTTFSYDLDRHWKPYTRIGYIPRHNENHEKDAMEMNYHLGFKYIF